MNGRIVVDNQTQPRRILVVEDNADTARSAEILLRLHGHETRIARNGPDAIEAALAWKPDVILLDIGLPGTDGFVVAERLRQEPSCRDTVIIAVTGYTSPEHLEAARLAGIDRHFAKPVDSCELLPMLSCSRAEVIASGPPVAGAVSLLRQDGSPHGGGSPLAARSQT